MRPLLASCLLLAFAFPLAAQQEWIGRKIYFRQEAEVRLPGEKVDWRKIAVPATVTQVNGDWLWIGRGWVKQSQVIHGDRAALDYMTAQLERDPSETWYTNRGAVWKQLGELEKAIADWTEAIRLDPQTAAVPYTNRGAARQAQGDFDKAVADYTAAIRLDSKYAMAYNNRGAAWRARGDLDKAVADCTEAIRLDPTYALAFINRGAAWRAKGDLDKALADYAEAIRLAPKLALAYNHRGNAWRARGDLDKALADYTEAIRLDPRNGEALYGRAVLEAQLRRTTAPARFRQILELQGWKGVAPYCVLGGHFAARHAGDEDAAKSLLEAGVKNLDPGVWPYPVVRFLDGKLDEPGLLKLATDNDKLTEVHCYLGLAAALAGRKEEARVHFRWVEEHGNKGFYEYGIAISEAKRLK